MRERIREAFRSLLPALAATAVVAAVYLPVLSWRNGLRSPDSPPLFTVPFPAAYGLDAALAKGSSLEPHWLLWYLLPPLTAHDLTYILDTLLLCAGGAYYLRGRGLAASLAWLGGVALGLSGYTFTLVSAGHRGYFQMMAWTGFAFGLIDRAFARRCWRHFVLLGLLPGWAVLTQPDVFTLVALLAGAYALWLTFAAGREDGESPARRILQVWPRFLLSAAAFLLAGGGVFRAFFGDILPQRRAQIDGPAAVQADTRSAEQRARQNWIFATDWSLPPEDALEFVAPCVFGAETATPDAPYWGRLGRTYQWWSHRRGFLSFRQHTVYLGAVQVAFALLAVLLWRTARRARDAGLPSPVLRDVPFWTVAALLALVLAMGRYTPVYRAFYALPYLSLMRAPVKFVHLLEFACAFLFALGLAGCLAAAAAKGREDRAGRTVRRWAAGCAAAAVLLLIAAASVAGRPADLMDHWNKLGIAALAPKLSANMAGALARGGLLLAAAALAGWLGRRLPARLRPLCVAGLWLVVSLDAVSVDRRFIQSVDFGPWYNGNAVTRRILQDGRETPAIANYATDNRLDDWLAHSLLQAGIWSSLPGLPQADHQLAGEALGNRPEALWGLTRSDYALLPIERLRQWRPSADFEPVVALDARPDGYAAGQPCGLLRRVRPTSFAAVVETWRTLPGDEAARNELRRPDWDPLRDPFVVAAPGSEPPPAVPAALSSGGERARLLQRRYMARGALSTRVDVVAPRGGVLLLREFFDPHNEALRNGQVVPTHRFNYLWTAVPLTPGPQEVVLRQRRDLFFPRASIAAGFAALVCLAAGAWDAARRGMDRDGR